MVNNAEVTALRFFMSKGLTRAQAAGIVGNIRQESSGNPNAPGGGLFQDIGGRGAGQGASVIAQLEKAWQELPANGLAQLRQATTPEAAARAFSNYFERPGVPMLSNREKYAREIYSNTQAGFGSGPLIGPNPIETGGNIIKRAVESGGPSSVVNGAKSALSGLEAFNQLGNSITNWINEPLTPIKFVGGAVLLYIGVRTLTGGTGPAREASRAGGYTKQAVKKAAEVAAVIPK